MDKEVEGGEKPTGGGLGGRKGKEWKKKKTGWVSIWYRGRGAPGENGFQRGIQESPGKAVWERVTGVNKD